MSDPAAKPEQERLLDSYAAAVLAFNAASAVLILHLAENSLPTAAQISTEEKARAAVVTARQKLWALYGTRDG